MVIESTTISLTYCNFKVIMLMIINSNFYDFIVIYDGVNFFMNRINLEKKYFYNNNI